MESTCPALGIFQFHPKDGRKANAAKLHSRALAPLLPRSAVRSDSLRGGNTETAKRFGISSPPVSISMDEWATVAES
jgi:hypothetical protein